MLALTKEAKAEESRTVNQFHRSGNMMGRVTGNNNWIFDCQFHQFIYCKQYTLVSDTIKLETRKRFAAKYGHFCLGYGLVLH